MCSTYSTGNSFSEEEEEEISVLLKGMRNVGMRQCGDTADTKLQSIWECVL